VSLTEEYVSVGQPGWWLLRLGGDLRKRWTRMQRWDRYFTGKHPLPNVAETADLRAFREFQEKARTNLCPVPVDATVARQLVKGINDGNGKQDAEAWGWWQRNRLDSEQKLLYRLMGRHGIGYVMDGLYPGDDTRPLITIESPEQVIVEHDPELKEPRAGLKAWWDDVAGCARAILWWRTGSTINRQAFRSKESESRSSHRTGKVTWSAAFWDLDGDAAIVTDIPIEEFGRMAHLGHDPVPEFHPMIDTQDRINLDMLNAMVTSRSTSAQQAWATGVKVVKEFDAATGQERPVNPYPRRADGTWINENPDGKFGYIPAGDVRSILEGLQFNVRLALLQTATPSYYVPSQLVNVATDTVMALAEMHIAKVLELNTGVGEGWESVLARVARRLGVDRDFSGHEMVWMDPKQVNPAVLADMGTKYKAIGYPLTMVAEKVGDSPATIERLRTEAAAEQLSMFGQQQGGGQAQQPAVAQAPQQLELAIPAELQGLV